LGCHANVTKFCNQQRYDILNLSIRGKKNAEATPPRSAAAQHPHIEEKAGNVKFKKHPFKKFTKYNQKMAPNIFKQCQIPVGV
jgi:hypothetical protein